MTKTTIYTRVLSGGDGSARTKYFVSEALRDFDGELDDERFCDDSSTLTIEHEGELTIASLITPVSYLFDSYEFHGQPDAVTAFAEQFGVPLDDLIVVPEEFPEEYKYVRVVHDGKTLAKVGLYKTRWECSKRDVRTYLSS